MNKVILLVSMLMVLNASAMTFKVETTSDVPKQVVLGQLPELVNYKITNKIPVPANVASINLLDNTNNTMSIVQNTCGNSVSANGSCTLTVSFKPKTIADRFNTGNLQVCAYGSIDCSQVTPVARKVTTVTAVDAKVTKALPANIVEGKAQDIAFTLTNHSSQDVSGVIATFAKQDGLTLTNYCASTLAAGKSCSVSGIYTPPSNTKSVEIPVTFTDANGDKIDLKTSAGVTKVTVTGKVSDALPANMLEAKTENIEFTFTNSTDGDATGVTTSIPVNGSGWTLVKNGCQSTLAKHSSCSITGTYTPPAGTKTATIPVTFSYSEGSDVTLSTSTTVTDINVNGVVSKVLPATIPENHVQSFAFTFTNSNKGEATGINVELPDVVSMPGLSITNNCATTLAANASCTVTGTYKPPVGTTTATIPVTFNYAEGAAITQSTSAIVSDVAVTGKVAESLPANIAENKSASFAFTFSNNSAGIANGISIVLPTNIAGLTITTDTCSSITTLAADASCMVSGTYKPPVDTKAMTIPVSLTYTEGNAIHLSTQTTVNDIAITGSATTVLPANIAENNAQNFLFTFSNGGNGDATGVSVTLPSNIVGLVFNVTDCKGTLAKNTSCTVSGSYTPPIGTKSINIPVTLNYNEGSAVKMSTNAVIGDVNITGTMTEKLANNVGSGSSNPIKFTFTNNSAGDAHNVKVTLPSGITGLSLTNNCPTTLLKGKSCTVDGTYTPTLADVGKTVNVTVNLSYAEGSQLSLNTSTVINNVVIQNTVSPGKTLLVNDKSTYPLTYTFKNNSTVEATNVNLILPEQYKDSAVNTCAASLAPDASCAVTLLVKGTNVQNAVTVSMGYNGSNMVGDTIILKPTTSLPMLFAGYNNILYLSSAYNADTGALLQPKLITVSGLDSPIDLVSALDNKFYSISEEKNEIQSCNAIVGDATTCTKVNISGDAFGDPAHSIISGNNLWISDFLYQDGLYRCAVDGTTEMSCKKVPALDASSEPLTGSANETWEVQQYKNFIYYTSSVTGKVYRCQINGTGSSAVLANCAAVTMTGSSGVENNAVSGSKDIRGLTFVDDPTFGSTVYISHSTLTQCRVTTDGNFTNCSLLDTLGAAGLNVTSLQLDTSHTFAYLEQRFQNKVYVCKVNKQTGSLNTCTDISSSFNDQLQTPTAVTTLNSVDII